MKCRLRDLLQARGMSQVDFAYASGLRPNTVSQLARNEFKRLDSDTAAKVCRYFGMQLGEMFYLEGDGDV